MASKFPNARQLRFFDEWLVDLNASAAYVRAGYAEKNANVDASKLLAKLLAKPELAAKAAATKKQQTEEAGLRSLDVLRELMSFAFLDVGTAYDDEGKLLPLKEMPEATRRSIASIETTNIGGDEGVAVLSKVKFHDKPRGLELLGKHLKMWTDKVLHEGGVSVEVIDPYAEAKK